MLGKHAADSLVARILVKLGIDHEVISMGGERLILLSLAVDGYRRSGERNGGV